MTSSLYNPPRLLCTWSLQCTRGYGHTILSKRTERPWENTFEYKLTIKNYWNQKSTHSFCEHSMKYPSFFTIITILYNPAMLMEDMIRELYPKSTRPYESFHNIRTIQLKIWTIFITIYHNYEFWLCTSLQKSTSSVDSCEGHRSTRISYLRALSAHSNTGNRR